MKNQNVYFPLFMLILSLLLADRAAHAQSSVDLMCRNKAKELAFQTYQTCVTEERATRLQDLKSRYKARMSEVKDEFQRELNDLNGKAPAEKPAAKPESAKAPLEAKAAKAKATKVGKAEKPRAGVATSLPAKQNDNGPALPMQAQVDAQTVVATPVSDAVEATPEPEIVEIAE